jgi:hypothetical protein
MQHQVLIIIDESANLGEKPMGIGLEQLGQIIRINPKGRCRYQPIIKGRLRPLLVPELARYSQRQAIAIGQVFYIGIMESLIGVFENRGQGYIA